MWQSSFEASSFLRLSPLSTRKLNPDMRDLTFVSAAGVALYALAVLLAILAARAARHAQRPHSEFVHWLFVAAMFVLFAVLRGFQIEDWLEVTLRSALRAEGVYQDRRLIQTVAASVIAIFAVVGVGYWMYQGMRHLADRCHGLVFFARVACFAMIALICLRLVSLHAVDIILYGFRVNWITDVGLTLFVALSAVLYSRLARQRGVAGFGQPKVRRRGSRHVAVRRSEGSRR